MAQAKIVDQTPFDVLEDETPLEAEARQGWEDILAAFNESDDENKISWVLRIYRVTGAAKLGSREPYLFTCTMPELNDCHDKLVNEYGTGTYRARIYQGGRIYRSFTIDVEAPIKKQVEQENKSGLSDLISVIRAENQKTNEMFAQILTRMSNPAPVQQSNPMEIVTGIIGAMAGIKSLFPVPPTIDHGFSAKDAIDVFKSGIEIAQNAAGGSGETGFGDIAKALIQSPLLENIIKSGQQPGPQNQPMHTYDQPMINRQMPPNQFRQPPTPQPDNQRFSMPPVAPPNPENMTIQQAQELFRTQITFLVNQAVRNSSPALYAELVLDQMNDEQINMMLNNPNIINELQQIDPRIGQFRHWFDNLLEEMKLILQDQEEPAEGGGDGIGATDRNGVDPRNPNITK